MGDERVAAESSAAVSLEAIVSEGVRGEPDVGALASTGAERLTVLLWHYHDDDLPGPDAALELRVEGLPGASGTARITHHRIDQHHSNAYAEWLRMGSPIAPDREQYEALQAASELALLEEPGTAEIQDGGLRLEFALPRQAVSLVTVEW
jgi:xylan 1,4-beta-xylosidase